MEFRFIPPLQIDLHFGANWNSILGQNGIPFYSTQRQLFVVKSLFSLTINKMNILIYNFLFVCCSPAGELKLMHLRVLNTEKVTAG